MKVRFEDMGEMFKDPFRFLPYCSACGAELSRGESPCRKCGDPVEWPIQSLLDADGKDTGELVETAVGEWQKKQVEVDCVRKALDYGRDLSELANGIHCDATEQFGTAIRQLADERFVFTSVEKLAEGRLKTGQLLIDRLEAAEAREKALREALGLCLSRLCEGCYFETKDCPANPEGCEAVRAARAALAGKGEG